MKKKSIFGYSLLFLLVVSSIVFAACAKQKAEASNFSFSCEQSAVKVSEGQDSVVKISLEIKNKAGEKNTLKAELFKLKQGGQEVSKSCYFGNNIIDKMEEEEFEKDKKMDVVLSVVLKNDAVGNYELWYGQDRLLEIRI